tara:strand:+ start:22 stop:648 length:627 start_codon:yes stop_codon:yes gene_type:complete
MDPLYGIAALAGLAGFWIGRLVQRQEMSSTTSQRELEVVKNSAKLELKETRVDAVITHYAVDRVSWLLEQGEDVWRIYEVAKLLDGNRENQNQFFNWVQPGSELLAALPKRTGWTEVGHLQTFSPAQFEQVLARARTFADACSLSKSLKSDFVEWMTLAPNETLQDATERLWRDGEVKISEFTHKVVTELQFQTSVDYFDWTPNDPTS